MNFLSLYKNSQVFKIALGIAILLIVYIASVFFDKMEKLDQSVELISTSNQTQLELEKLLSIVSNYETSLRSYIITNDETYVKDRFVKRGEIERNIKKLKKLSSNNALVQKDLDRLKMLFDLRFELFRETLTLAKSKSFDKNELNSMLLKGSSITTQIREAVYKRMNSESKKLKKLNDDHQFELKDSITSAFLLVILSLLILLLSFNKMKIDIKELKKTNDELKFLNHSFNNAEKVAGFGHWKINLKTNTYTFSDNYYRLMGLEPQAFAPCLENMFKCIHPDDQQHVRQLHEESLQTLQPVSVMCRYVLPNGDIKYIMSVGSFTHNSNGDLVKVGVNFDITDQYKKTAELEESNKELKLMNAELESFNNIASHDLQEPLRKIQMFISRLEETEEASLSDKGKDYFSRIGFAANRMQTLIIDLVNYTRAIKGAKDFVNTDLNQLVQKVLSDLAPNIEEKNAVVEVEPLPIIKGITFQVEQLFINLIMNAVKYSKEDSVPKIHIGTGKFSADENYQSIPLSDSDYHKIVVSDNGIGFKQEFADKIFLLFHRLETDSKYSGTGLGLAICKKIIENHNGYIKAASQPEHGTEFSIYFPKELV